MELEVVDDEQVTQFGATCSSPIRNRVGPSSGRNNSRRSCQVAPRVWRSEV
jgi:hypothetical protein